ncbi:hypothetical protein A1O3_07110 [Capronia epimyces CBS 606.96]|uniref:Clr5 domain-containing protein n=1 Tax=Capronia epimyces CBS 606.96 TaxID=1182542 RepID=W9XUZ7_9EURO|nr:uncharacterized protein A1O3_07110 [Capronia epimyces CBS 606.96]EXJ80826.1 hypothetical protein A1O3_07110 [Capronia epimyces CBS 606.96]
MASSPDTDEKWRVKLTPAATPPQLEAREGPAAAQWQAVKEEIRYLYQDKPLRDVRRILEQRHGFRATERMYKARLSQWGFSKNYSDKDYQICAVLNHFRRNSGKASTAFVIHGHKRTLRDLHKYIKGRKMSEDEFLASALKNIDCSDQQFQLQHAHVRAYTPEPEGETSTYDDPQNSADPATAGRLGFSPPGTGPESVSGSSGSGSCLFVHPYTPSSQNPSPRENASPEPLLQTPTTNLTSSEFRSYSSRLSPSRDSAASAFIWPSQQTPFTPSPLNLPVVTVSDEIQRPATGQNTSTSIPCQRLGKQVEYMALQIVDAPVLKSLCGHDDIRSWRLMSDTYSTDSEDYEVVCPTCHELTRDHFISLPNLELPARQVRNILNEDSGESESIISVPTSTRGHEHSWRWVARCFAACIYLSRGNDTLSRISLADADAEFEKMLSPRQDPKVLLALNQTLQILHVHNQGRISKTIMSSAHNVAERVLGPDDPLTTCIRWMVYVTDLNMRDRDITSSTLQHLHTQFVQRHGYTDPRSIAAMYCYGYMLNVERQVEQAESVLRKVYEVSSAHLGPQHLQSISALTNLHRAIERQGRVDEAIAVLGKAIADSRETLGRNHPRRLESMRLLAILHEGCGHMDIAERLYWQVLEGRIKMLGRNHHYTQGMKVDLEAFLKRTGKWTVNYNSHSARETGTIESAAQLRIQDLFEWDPDDKWYDTDTRTNDLDGGGGSGGSIDSAEDTRSQTEAF